jgi:Zn finger protein HypA/HybF involved in hydrogenase expression
VLGIVDVAGLVECLGCGEDFPPVACRWRCPSCGLKASCCEGAPGGFERVVEREGVAEVPRP